jgi:hypothetical protein
MRNLATSIFLIYVAVMGAWFFGGFIFNYDSSGAYLIIFLTFGPVLGFCAILYAVGWFRDFARANNIKLPK